MKLRIYNLSSNNINAVDNASSIEDAMKKFNNDFIDVPSGYEGEIEIKLIEIKDGYVCGTSNINFGRCK